MTNQTPTPAPARADRFDAGELATESHLAGRRGTAQRYVPVSVGTLSLQDTERHRLLLIAGAGAVAICGVVIVVLASTVNRPMIELQEQMERVGDGDLDSFGHVCQTE